MAEWFARLERATDQRATGALTRWRTGAVQLCSTSVFGVLAAAMADPRAQALLMLEALGQAFLAWHNLRGAGETTVRYFAGRAGLGALIAFTALITLRVSWGQPGWLVASCAALLWFPVLFPRWRRDLFAGLGISAAAASFAWTVHVDRPLAAALHALYAVLLVIGVLKLKPWQAELINLPLFAAMAWSLGGW